jgi:hypothetical protein
LLLPDLKMVISNHLVKILQSVEKAKKEVNGHSEPFAHCHSERSEESDFMAQDRLREESSFFQDLRPFALLRVTRKRWF